MRTFFYRSDDRTLDFPPYSCMPVCTFAYRNSPFPLGRKRDGQEEMKRPANSILRHIYLHRCKIILSCIIIKYFRRRRMPGVDKTNPLQFRTRL